MYFQVRQLPEDFPVEDHLVGQHDLCAGGPRNGFRWRRALINLAGSEVEQGLPGQITGVERVAIENNDFHEKLKIR